MSMESEILDVAAAIIEYKYRYLVLKRAGHKENAGLWEFPGGKLDGDESLKQCVEREIFEELGVKAEAGRLLATVETPVGERIIRLHAVETTIDREPSQFKDHSDSRWLKYEELT